MNSRNLICMAALGVVCLLGTAAVQAQEAPAGKVAVIRTRQATFATVEGKQALADLQSQFASRQKEMEDLSRKINELRQLLNANQTDLSDEQKAKAQVQGERLTQLLDRKQNEYQEDVNAAQAEVMDRIGRKMMDVLDRYARQNGFVVVFDSSAQNSPVLFAAGNIDVTQDIIKLYDQTYPLKATAAPASNPASSAPEAAPPAAKP